jgi:1-hydroxycarotenoid 3,4-desaturase
VVIIGAAIDAGPTVFTMRWAFERILGEIGCSLDDCVTLTPLAILARHAWSANDTLDLFADEQRSAEAIAAFAGAREADGYLRFCRRARAIFETLDASFIQAPRPSPIDLVRRAGLAGLPALTRISPFATLWGELGAYFRDERLRQLFGRYATYCGSSPYLAPATLMLVAHVEQAGVWSVEGGMHALGQSLARLAALKGATFRHGARAASILTAGGRASGVVIEGGESIPADAVIMNGDPAALADGLLGEAASRSIGEIPRASRSLSAITWAMKATTRGFPLLRHNVFFSDDYRAEFDDIFSRARPPRSPTVYVCAQDRADSAEAPDSERLLCLVNAPANGDSGEPSELQRCEDATFRQMARCGLTISNMAAIRTTPARFDALFPATGGALYGRASHGWMASFARPGSRTKVPGLYLAGGGVHPGPGVPMAVLSGRLAASSVLQDLTSK